ncbi:antitoxin Xre/MbcA/ParS toxin-binding domain-containing protein [Salinisphaera sp. RV14]|uniref:antitoxin Xre/MbcA/ParS toxin-binding domain-containing protein n=1 Tax=unclassified Salinisphaera TaxID=2649847 RepID=UPI003F83D289
MSRLAIRQNLLRLARLAARQVGVEDRAERLINIVCGASAPQPQRPEPKRPEPTTATTRTRAARRTKAPAVAAAAPDAAELLNVNEFAVRIGVKSGQTVRNRVRRGQLIGWKDSDLGSWRLPAGQLNAEGQPILGLAEVLARFPDHESAWRWLNTPLPVFDGATPLAVLEGGNAASVHDALPPDA